MNENIYEREAEEQTNFNFKLSWLSINKHETIHPQNINLGRGMLTVSSRHTGRLRTREPGAKRTFQKLFKALGKFEAKMKLS